MLGIGAIAQLAIAQFPSGSIIVVVTDERHFQHYINETIGRMMGR